MKRRIFKASALSRAAALFLALALIFTMAGCGKTEIKTISKEDYGGKDAASEDDDVLSVHAEYLDADYSENQIIDYDFKWNTSFVSHEKNVNADINSKNKLEANDLKKYLLTPMSEFGDLENVILSAVFEDSYSKIDDITYSGSSNYYPFLYKYRTLSDNFKKKFGEEPGETVKSGPETFYQIVANYKPLIDASLSQSYDWEDNENYYIHMYEGTIDNMPFGLLLAYDKVDHIRYIFLKPISIDKYFPNRNIKTLKLFNSVDSEGHPDINPNECELTEPEAAEKVSAFVTDKLKMDLSVEDLGNYYWLYNVVNDPFIGSISGLHVGLDPAAEGVSRLVFSDSNYLRSIYGYLPEYDTGDDTTGGQADFFPRTIELLAQQDDPLAEQVQKGQDFREALVMQPLDGEDENLIPDGSGFYVDGYAFYLNPPYQRMFESNEGTDIYRQYEDTPVNTGVIEITSKGIFGEDIVQMMDIDEAVECKLVTPETVTETVKNAVISMDIPESLEESGVLGIKDVYFSFYTNSEDENVPAWIFSLEGDRSNYTAMIVVNATSGELIKYE